MSELLWFKVFWSDYFSCLINFGSREKEREIHVILISSGLLPVASTFSVESRVRARAYQAPPFFFGVYDPHSLHYKISNSYSIDPEKERNCAVNSRQTKRAEKKNPKNSLNLISH
jgi:hypothetical protein